MNTIPIEDQWPPGRPMPEWMKKIREKGGAPICLIAAIFFIVIGIIDLRHGFDSASWPMVSGKIISTVVEARGVLYPVYEYLIAGRTYRCKKVAFQGFFVEDSASRWVSQHPIGSCVLVFYNPKMPDIAVLEPGITKAIYYTLLTGFILLSLAVFFYFQSRHPWFSILGLLGAISGVVAAVCIGGHLSLVSYFILGIIAILVGYSLWYRVKPEPHL